MSVSKTLEASLYRVQTIWGLSSCVPVGLLSVSLFLLTLVILSQTCDVMCHSLDSPS